MNIRLISSVFLFFLTVPALADETRVREFMQQLNAPTAAARDAAEAGLTELGTGILPLLPTDAQMRSLPPEIALRVGRVRLELQRQKSLDTLEPATFLLSEIPKDAMSIAAWCRWLEEKSGNEIRLALAPGEELAARQITLETASSTNPPDAIIPFWAVVSDICKAAGLTHQFRDMQPAVFLVPAPQLLYRQASYAGPFRVEPKKVTSTLLLSSRTHATQVQTEIAWEPRLTPVFLDVQLTKAAADEHELPLAPRVHQVPVGRGTVATTFDIPITLKNFGDWKTIAQAENLELDCKLTAVVAGVKHPFTFTQLDRKIDRAFPPESQRVAAVLVTLTNLRREVRPSAVPPDETVKEIVATVRYRYEKAHGAMESHRTWVYDNPAWLEAPDGTRVASSDYEMLRQTTDEISLDLYFPDDGQKLNGWKLVYPRSTGIYAVEYDFRMRVPAP